MAHKLDFVVIGAAKSATTSLHELLKDHPGIYIPKAKEVPFFSDNEVFEKGIERYIKAYFANANTDQKWGTITPQYMLDWHDVSVKEIAKRIHNTYPNIKIIALLRNPAERAFSHYKMQVQRGHELRDFDSIVYETIKDTHQTRKSTDAHKSYIFTSEYGRILNAYYSLFPHDNIMVIATDNLRDNPVAVTQEVCSFIGADPSYIPKNPTKKHRRGGSKPKLKYLTPGFLYNLPFIELVWKRLTPMFIRKNVEYFVNLWNTKADNSVLDKKSPAYSSLMKYFKDDTKKLEELTGKNMPWDDQAESTETS